MKNIIVAFTDHPAAQKIRTILMYNGISVAGVCTSGAQVLSLARRLQGNGIIICASRFHDMTTGFLAEQLAPDYDFLMLVHSNDLMAREGSGLYSLLLPLRKSDLIDSVKMLSAAGSTKRVFEEQEKAEKDKPRESRPQRSPEERKLIDGAKRLLMERNHLTEEQAHRFLQKYSMNKGSKITDMAKLVLDGWYDDNIFSCYNNK